MKEQNHIFHNSMVLEHFARNLFGDKYFGSVGWTNTTTWRKFYGSCFEVLRASFRTSVGSIDAQHIDAIESELAQAVEKLKKPIQKDALHVFVIVALFRLVFLLMGRLPYNVKGKRRNLSTFRTLNYCQTEEQLSWLLHGYMSANATDLGFKDSIAVEMAFNEWVQLHKLQSNDRSNYVAWVRNEHSDVYRKFRSS